MSLTIQFIILASLLGLSAFFSASEAALFSLTHFQAKKLISHFPRRGLCVSRLLNSSRRTLATILIGNMVVNVTASSLAAAISVRLFGDAGVGIAWLSMTFLLLLVGEATPKMFAIRNQISLAMNVALPVDILAKALAPLRRITNDIADFFIKRFSGEGAFQEPLVTQAELKSLVSIGEREGILDEDEKEMIHAVFEFHERHISEIMTPRVDMIASGLEASLPELMRLMQEGNHRKIPIYAKSIDDIVGLVYTKELMLAEGARAENFDWRTYIRPILFVPQAKPIDEALIEMQRSKTHMAIIIDDFGGTAGLVTREDILEELVGEIHDEYDKEEEFDLIRRIDAHTYEVNGRCPIRQFKEALGLVALQADPAGTLAGYLLSSFGRIPKLGDSLRKDSLLFTVKSMRHRRIKRVLVEMHR